MPNVVIEHPDGRRYSTSTEGFHRLYEAEGFEVVGEESDATFELVGVPKEKAPRRAPRAKVAADETTPAADDTAPETAPESEAAE